MDSSIVTDSIKDAWARTRVLLLTEPDVGRWLKYGFIAMLGAAALGVGAGVNVRMPMGSSGGGGGHDGGGGGDLDLPGNVGPQVLDAFSAALQWLAANIANLVLLAIGLVTVWVVLWLLYLYIRNVFRFIFVDAIAADREPAIGESWRRHTGQGLSLLLWNILLGLVPLILLIIALVPILSSIGLLASGKPLGIALGVGGMAGMIGLILLATSLLAIGRALTNDFLVPAMYARRCGVFSGWRHVGRAWRGEFWNVVLFYLLKLLVGVGAAIVAGVIGLFALLLLVLPVLSLGAIVSLVLLSGMEPGLAMVIFGGPFLVAVVLGGGIFGYILDTALLPIFVLFQSYSLAFVGKLDASLRTI